MDRKWKIFQQYGIDDDTHKKYFYWMVIEDKPLPADVIVSFPRETPNADGYGSPEIQANAELIASAPTLKAQRNELLAALQRIHELASIRSAHPADFALLDDIQRAAGDAIANFIAPKKDSAS